MSRLYYSASTDDPTDIVVTSEQGTDRMIVA